MGAADLVRVGSAPALPPTEVQGARAGARVLAAREYLRLLHLLGAGGGQRLDEEHPARGLEVGQALEAMVGQALREGLAGWRARHRYHAGHDLLLADLVRDG